MSKQLKVIPVGGRIGAIIEGVSLSGVLSKDTVEDIRELLLKHKVIFFRNQHHLNDQEQEAFARHLGEPIAHPTVKSKDNTNYVLELNSNHGGRADVWHTDVTFVSDYPQASILRGVVIPESGGDTVWANTATAYELLPQELREFVDKLWAVHTNSYDYADTGRVNKNFATEEEAKKYRQTFASTVYETEHPVVRVHPETGERTLVLGGFAKSLIGFSNADSKRLIAILQDHITSLENTVRWNWAPGDVAIWDNRATQHYAVNDYEQQHRVVRRVTIAGDIPISVDGRKSSTKIKEPLLNIR